MRLQREPNKMSKKAAESILTLGLREVNIRSTPAVKKIAKNMIPYRPAALFNSA